jgi:hypothetical protein
MWHDAPIALLALNRQRRELLHSVTLVAKTVHSRPAKPLSPGLFSIYRGHEQSQRRPPLRPLWKDAMKHDSYR